MQYFKPISELCINSDTSARENKMLSIATHEEYHSPRKPLLKSPTPNLPLSILNDCHDTRCLVTSFSRVKEFNTTTDKLMKIVKMSHYYTISIRDALYILIRNAISLVFESAHVKQHIK